MNEVETWVDAEVDEEEISWGELGRRALVVAGLVMLAPAGVTIVLALVFMLIPVAVVGIPFMLPVFFGGAAAEHKREQDALAWHAAAHAR